MHANANAFTISYWHLNAHLNAQHSNAFAFVNKPTIDPVVSRTVESGL